MPPLKPDIKPVHLEDSWKFHDPDELQATVVPEPVSRGSLHLTDGEVLPKAGFPVRFSVVREAGGADVMPLPAAHRSRKYFLPYSAVQHLPLHALWLDADDYLSPAAAYLPRSGKHVAVKQPLWLMQMNRLRPFPEALQQQGADGSFTGHCLAGIPSGNIFCG